MNNIYSINIFRSLILLLKNCFRVAYKWITAFSAIDEWIDALVNVSWWNWRRARAHERTHTCPARNLLTHGQRVSAIRAGKQFDSIIKLQMPFSLFCCHAIPNLFMLQKYENMMWRGRQTRMRSGALIHGNISHNSVNASPYLYILLHNNGHSRRRTNCNASIPLFFFFFYLAILTLCRLLLCHFYFLISPQNWSHSHWWTFFRFVTEPREGTADVCNFSWRKLANKICTIDYYLYFIPLCCIFYMWLPDIAMASSGFTVDERRYHFWPLYRETVSDNCSSVNFLCSFLHLLWSDFSLFFPLISLSEWNAVLCVCVTIISAVHSSWKSPKSW